MSPATLLLTRSFLFDISFYVIYRSCLLSPLLCPQSKFGHEAIKYCSVSPSAL